MNANAHSPAPHGARTLRCPAADIDASGPWIFWSAPPSPALRRSLERHGQMAPVLVDMSGGAPVLVAGAARVAALADMGREVLCLDLGPLDDAGKGLAYLQSNLGPEPTDVRVVAAMRYFRSIPGCDMGPVLESLDLAPRSKRLRLVEAWLSLPTGWDRHLDGAPLACAELLASFSEQDLAALEALFDGLSWSRGNAVNLLTWLRETCLRDGAGAAALLQDCGVGGILAEGLSPKDAMTRISQQVRLRRFPRLSAMERDFAEAARRVAAGTRWRIVQPDQFESDAVEMTVRVRNVDELRAAGAELARLASREDLDGLFPAEGA
jgi:ParB family chromosome partitioning protein